MRASQPEIRLLYFSIGLWKLTSFYPSVSTPHDHRSPEAEAVSLRSRPVDFTLVCHVLGDGKRSV